MDEKRSLPEGFTKEDIQEIIRKWDEFNIRIDSGEEFSTDEGDYDDNWSLEYCEMNECWDRYCHYGKAMFMITTITYDNVTYISESVQLCDNEGNCNDYWISELREMI